MGSTLKQEAMKSAIAENISTTAKRAAELLQGWGSVSRVGFIAVSAMANKIELAHDASNLRDALDQQVQEMHSSEVARSAKVNPLMWKPQLEHIALLSLRDAGFANANGDKAKGEEHFEVFAKAISNARSAGPISNKTLGKILDRVEDFRSNTSFLHMALALKSDIRAGVVNVLLAAKVNPDFKLLPTDPTALMVACEIDDVKIKDALLRAGASDKRTLLDSGAASQAVFEANYLLSQLKKPEAAKNPVFIAGPRP